MCVDKENGFRSLLQKLITTLGLSFLSFRTSLYSDNHVETYISRGTRFQSADCFDYFRGFPQIL
jgi:hypothetical protein